MEIISEINFPILKYIGTREIFAHKDFKPFFRKLDPKKLSVSEKKEFEDTDWTKYNAYKEIKPTAETRNRWPVLAIDPLTFQKQGSKIIYEIDQMFYTLWQEILYDNQPILVTPEMGREICKITNKDLKQWYEEIFKKGYTASGILIHTIGFIVLFFISIPPEGSEEEEMVSVIGLKGRYISYIHNEFVGYISDRQQYYIERNELTIKDAMDNNISLEKAFFMEQLDFIFRFLFFNKIYRTVPKTVSKGEFIKGTDIMYYADTHAVIYEKPIKN